MTHPVILAARDALEALQSRSEMVVSVDWDGVRIARMKVRIVPLLSSTEDGSTPP